ncbi:SPOR domain-containing protein [Janthinobacterium agaricidamnosum]|uniref:SPOR domain-containing protein n=1 Tax=Janthinobacterium agaricidamnosum NBRC 102515 = DSM 9628 TaxID=1349767 RepID=W0V8U7_9BURK|nr:SPOR domain-containing protein [Janthinobacterium agaricidamnosum]CDG85254.1 putative uncharacterized protein [Janthinobacterium agaricidamnosum NBRC 102515 = DSM 9628]
MLKFGFWLLLGVNLLVYALGQGYLGNYRSEVREPARLQNQLNTGQLNLISQDQALRAALPPQEAAPPVPELASAPAPARQQLYACTEVGNFVLADARRFEAQLEVLDLGDRQSRRNVPGQDISSYIVYIPPQGNKEGADRKANELKQLGVTNYFIMSDNTPMRWAISLGVFKQEAGAQALLAALMRQGVHSAKVGPRYTPSKQLSFQFRNLDGATRARLERIKQAFPDQEMRSCK